MPKQPFVDPPRSSFIPTSFTNLKSRILTSLSIPPASYTDASPKGSLDTAIIPLVDRLNALEGAVTTSSCAGRISVFLEGWKGAVVHREGDGTGGGSLDEEDMGNETGMNDRGEDDESGSQKDHAAVQNGVCEKENKSVPGGKGSGGRWLFVTHDPVKVPEDAHDELVTRLFRLSHADVNSKGVDIYASTARYVRFAFEPMILHVATASLAFAAPILSAAISAGFRESGVQSLKNLTDPSAFPMVAIRSAGLALESVIGVLHEPSSSANRSASRSTDGKLPAEHAVESLVDERYLRMLLNIANERFVANTQRMKRFEEVFFGRRTKEIQWEEKDARQERKRREGLQRSKELKTYRDGCATAE